jgi:hypothetical protein
MRWIVKGVLAFLLMMTKDPWWYFAAWYYGLVLLPFYCLKHGVGFRLKPL